jgi:LAO/AO transport system kinase
MKPFFVYLLRCGDGTYYAGHTDDLDHRMQQHFVGVGGYAAGRGPVELVWRGEFETRAGAIEFERRIKGWSRAKKEALIAGDWEKIRSLAVSRSSRPGMEPVPSLGPELASAKGLRQAQPERGSAPPERGSAPPERGSAPPERGSAPPERGDAQPDRGVDQPDPEVSSPTPSVRPELVEGPAPALLPAKGLRQAQPERGSAPPEPRSAQPEPRSAQPEPRSAQPDQGSAQPHLAHDLHTRILRGAPAVQRRALAKAITLIESTRPDHRTQADALLTALSQHPGNAFRLGISGVPGVGKSTFIETLGLHLIAQGHQVAVLAVDPSSSVSGGSILGDKTRMEQLSVHPKAFIRPSPSSGTLGGVAEKTREAMLLCEAAGYDIVIVETVGVGQSETTVANMTDMFVLLQLPNAGDDLQAIKKGVMELADLVVINKADLDPDAATRAQAQITSALRLFTQHGRGPRTGRADSAHEPPWRAQVLLASALRQSGIEAFWQVVCEFRQAQGACGALEARRRHQALAWMWERIESGLRDEFREAPGVRELLPRIIHEVEAARLPPSTAARQLLQARNGLPASSS